MVGHAGVGRSPSRPVMEDKNDCSIFGKSTPNDTWGPLKNE